MKRKLIVLVLVLAGVLLIFNKPIKNYFVKRTGEHYQISKISKKEVEKNKKKETTFDFDAVKPLDTKVIAKSQLSRQSEGLPVIASVAVPRVGICLPVFKGLQNDGLYYGAGTLSDDQEMGEGNYGIASHRSDQADLLFTPLDEVVVGDKIYLTDLTKVYTYVAVWKDHVDPSSVEVLDVVPGKRLVTLLTCGDIYATTRLVVQGELESVTSIEVISDAAAEAFNLPTKTY
ncbi:class A sortase [Enterococcus hulanensis]|uniref:class A sortase n=1 Tax=Enterococcus hulanensis TaxID=2559929 RepID=UPI00288C6CB1|nr:class A sortase [Enterococcus hulanensis]MDT2662988.1 class A sortase [Enterococcus hulanensis]